MEWFKHDTDASTDGKLSVLRMQCGSVAVDAYWYVLEQIYKYEKPFCVSLLNEDMTGEVYSNSMRVLCGCMQMDCAEMAKHMRAMCELGLLDAIDDETGFDVMSKRANEALSAANAKSTAARKAAQTRWSKADSEVQEQGSDAGVMQSDANAVRTDRDYKTKDYKTKDLDNSARKARFVPPTVEEVAAYAKEKGYVIDAERFVNFYESKNWMVGKNKMTKWKASVANWAKDAKGGFNAKDSEYAGAF